MQIPLCGRAKSLDSVMGRECSKSACQQLCFSGLQNCAYANVTRSENDMEMLEAVYVVRVSRISLS